MSILSAFIEQSRNPRGMVGRFYAADHERRAQNLRSMGAFQAETGYFRFDVSCGAGNAVKLLDACGFSKEFTVLIFPKTPCS